MTWLFLIVVFGILGYQQFFIPSNRVNSHITYDIPIDSSIYPDSIDDSTPLSSNTNINMPDYRNDPCIIMSVKGLPKTGTHWLETTLKLIKTMTCESNQLITVNNNSNSNSNSNVKKSKFCSKSKVIIHEKHELKSFEFDSKFVKKHKINPNKNRWCQIVPLRDPRNRVLSFFMMYNSPGGILTTVNLSPHRINDTLSQLEQFVLERFEQELNETIVAWHLYTNDKNRINKYKYNELHTYFVESEENKGRSFLYFYEMYVLSAKEILNQLIYFLGINQYWTQKMIYQLEYKLNWDNIRNQGYTSFRSKFNLLNNNVVDSKHQKMNICKYKLYLSNSTMQFCDKKMYQARIKAPLLFDLINDTCTIPNS